MYDVVLKADLLELNKNIYDTSLSYLKQKEMQKIIRRRTTEKLELLKCLLQNRFIDYDCYSEMMNRTEYDYREAQLYCIGLRSI